MSRIARIVVLLTALTSRCAVLAAAAGAVTWETSGDTAFTATGVAGTLSSTGVSISCSGADAIGAVGSSPSVGAVWTAITGTASFTGGRIAGIPTQVACNYTFTAVAWVAGPPAQTSGNIDVTCD